MAEAATALETAMALPIDGGRMRRTVERLAALGSHPLGFRVAGTPEDRLAAQLAADELAAAGLEGVAVEPVPVHGWRLRAAVVEIGGRRFEGASMGGVPATPPGGARGRLVDVGDGRRRRLDRLDLGGRVALLAWRRASVTPADVALELGRRGAAAVLLFAPDGGPYYQSPGALGSFNSHWHAGAPPMLTLRREDAAELLALARGDGREAHVVLDVEAGPAQGANTVGYLRGRSGGAPIVVGAHHDGWFRAAFDNASGVAVVLELARALTAAGVRPRHMICFSSRTGEEWGTHDSAYDWCVGAHRQIAGTHRDWAARSPFHLCVEASGHPGLRLLVESPPELAGWARRCLRAAGARGLLTSGWRLGRPESGTELWPYLVAGVPGLSVFTWETRFARTDYHTPLDTTALVDFDHLERLARAYAVLLLDADRLGERLLDHGARARELRRLAGRAPRPLPGLSAAAERHAAARGRAVFPRAARGLHGLDAQGRPAYPHEQAARDLRRLEQALEALGRGEHAGAARHLARVGDNVLCAQLSPATLARRRERLARDAAGDGWAAASHLTPSPDLFAELASLRGEPGARAPGAWIERSLLRHARRAELLLARRAAGVERSLSPAVERRGART